MLMEFYNIIFCCCCRLLI